LFPLKLDLFDASIEVSVLGGGYGEPSVASYAQTAVKAVGSVTSDCSQVLG